MTDIDLTILLASVVAGATPIVLATLGETISEKAGLINLSLDGTILLSAMTAFAVALHTGSLLVGFCAAALVGGLVAAVVAFFSITLNQSQVAVGFVLTLMTRDLAYFLGNPYSRVQGIQIMPTPIPFLCDIPVIGPIFFQHNPAVYFSLCMIFLVWAYIYKTPMGLKLRAVGEHPRAAFTRGIDPNRTQFLYAVTGGLFVGLAGASFSLFSKAGWADPRARKAQAGLRWRS